ncbi:MAG: hypothetical protein JXR76_08360 [Deltaproteobacteria bacterium]|nr:hypothetical protein [Deltaproteobacteria bacterium]
MKYIVLWLVIVFAAACASESSSESEIEKDSGDSGDDSSGDDDDSNDDSGNDDSGDDSSGDDSSGDTDTGDDDTNHDSGDDDSADGDDRDNDTANTDDLEWQEANLTWYESYPEEGSEECDEYNGCEWAGWFAGLPDQMSPDWVAATNIASVHSDVFGEYNGKTLRLRGPEGQEIDVVVYDMCSDDDCSGCCTQNMRQTGFLIDLEIHTADRFGVHSGVVEFTCLDCDN